MARTMRAAFEAVAEAEGRRFELAVRLALPSRPHAPVEPQVRQAWAGVDDRYLKRVARRLCARYGYREVDVEEAVSAVLLDLLQKRPELFRQDPEDWEGLLAKLAYYWLIGDRIRARPHDSLDFLLEAGEEGKLSKAELCVSLTSSAEEDSRYLAPPRPGEEWSRLQVIGALQRFRDERGHPPKARECRSSNGLPSTKTIQSLFGTLSAALLEAGMVPEEFGRRRRKWTAVEVARICRSFYRWKGWWPERSDLLLYPEFLPSPAVVERRLGKLRSGQIRRRAEAILRYAEASA